MRVALLSANGPPYNAIGNQLAEKVSFFVERGADVRVLVESAQEVHPTLRPYVHVLPAPQPCGDEWRFLTTADLIVADYSQYFPWLDLLPLLSQARPRVLFDYHGVTPASLWAAHNRARIEQGDNHRGLVWCADIAIAHSAFAARELAQPTSWPAQRLRLLPYVIDTDLLQPAPTRRPLLRQLGLDAATLLLFVGRVAPNKRVPLLVEVLDRLRDVVPPVHAVVVGDASDLYGTEADRCRHRADDLRLADRVHFLGQVRLEQLRDAYHSADVFVMPSLHEGFCLPVLEAMACGLPVVAARATALPETVGSAGLTFIPDDANDLARQVRRVLDKVASTDDAETRRHRDAETKPDSVVSASRRPGVSASSLAAPSPRLRVAIVACRYGTDFVGGAETSLRTIATTLSQSGYHVEVFTTRLQDEHHWADSGAEDSSVVDGVAVHRFGVDARDAACFQLAQQRLAEGLEPISRETERAFLEHSIRSRRLIDTLGDRTAQFDAIIVGPYLFGLTCDVARAFPDQTLVLPCFHDESAARLPSLLATYRHVGGLLYHSPEEQRLAEVELGVNHPRSRCIGTYLAAEAAGDPQRGRQRVGAGRRYVLYAGRYSPHKNLPLLLQYADRYAAKYPERFTFAFIGQGPVPIPTVPWAKDLGYVEDAVRRDLIAGADALVQLSCCESLSLVALQAWDQGVPAIVHRDCAVLAAQVQRSQGGRAIADDADFAAALDDLWEQPQRWQNLGQQGQAYVRARYGSRSTFVEAIEDAVRGLSVPLGDHMRRLGRLRAAQYSRSAWREQFGAIVDDVLHAPPRPIRDHVEVQPRTKQRTVVTGLSALLVPVRVHNHGSHPLVAEGPARTVLRGTVCDVSGQPLGHGATTTPLPGLVLPGRTVAASVPVAVPERPGVYQVCFRAEPAEQADESRSRFTGEEAALRLQVTSVSSTDDDRPGAAFVETVQAALVQAEPLQRLPDDYDDITEGWLAAWKRRIKKTLLNNFKRAYVDVVSRQQSAFNRHVLTVLQELAESCAALAHAQQCGIRNAGCGRAEKTPAPGAGINEIGRSHSALDESRQRCAELEERLARLEAQMRQREGVRS